MLKFLLGAGLAAAALSAAPAAFAQSEPFVGQLTPTAASYCPVGWSAANGQLISISQNDALFSLFGTTYGGDGRTTFALPDLRGRMATGAGAGPGLTFHAQGASYGNNQVSLLVSNLANHGHLFLGSHTAANQAALAGATLGTVTVGMPFADPSNLTQVLRAGSIGNAGGGLPVNIQQPYTTVLWCVAMYGIYPSRS